MSPNIPLKFQLDRLNLTPVRGRGKSDSKTDRQTHRRIVQNHFSRRFEGCTSQIRSYLEVDILHDTNTSIDMEVIAYSLNEAVSVLAFFNTNTALMYRYSEIFWKQRFTAKQFAISNFLFQTKLFNSLINESDIFYALLKLCFISWSGKNVKKQGLKRPNTSMSVPPLALYKWAIKHKRNRKPQKHKRDQICIFPF